MREIKFRSYNPITKKMYYDFDQSISEVKLGKSIHQFVYDNGFIFDSLMQFTGLKDKSGIDIYEGDIIRILYTDWSSKSDSDPRTLEQYLIDISETGVVEFNDNSWEVKIYSKKYDDYSHCSISCGTHGRTEIIGNIHENPELLCTSQSI